MYERRGIVVDGGWQSSAGAGVIEVVNPSTEEGFGTVAVSGPDEVDEIAGVDSA